LEEDFEEWKDRFIRYLKDQSSSTTLDDNENEQEAYPELDFKIEFENEENGFNNTHHHYPSSEITASTKFYFSNFNSLCVEKRELRSDTSNGSTIHLEFDISNLKTINYETADNLAILPKISEEVVNRVGDVLGYDLTSYFKISPILNKKKKFKFPFPTPTTIQTFLTNYCDLISIPRRSTITSILPYITDEGEYQNCKRLVKDKDCWKTEVEEMKRSFYEILELFPSLEIPLDHFIHVCPKLQPRYYTISSSSKVSPNIIHITVSVIREELDDLSTSDFPSHYEEDDDRVFHGVCTTYLSNLDPHYDSIQMFIRESSFFHPESLSTPLILIGPGFGLNHQPSIFIYTFYVSFFRNWICSYESIATREI